MRICFFNDSLGVGGAEVWAVDATRRLAARGHAIVMGCPSGSWIEHQSVAAGLPLFDYPIEPEFEHNLRWQLTEAIVEHEIDLICCGIPGSRTEAPLLHRAVQEAGRGAVVLRLGVAPGDGALSPEQIGLGMGSVQGILAVSDDIRTRLITQFPSFGADRVHVHYNGVDVQRFKAAGNTDRSRIRRRLGLPSHGLLVAAVGRLDRVKNHAALLQAAPSILSRYPDTHVVIAGDGAEKAELLKLAADLDIAGNVHFTGFVDDVPALLSAVDIVAHPSYSEGVPNALIEAMAAGLPTVATRVGGIPEVVSDDGTTGLLVPRDDVEQLGYALCRLIEDEAERHSIGERAREHVRRHFDRETCLTALESWFETVAASAPASPPALQPAARGQLIDLPDLYFARGCSLLNAVSR